DVRWLGFDWGPRVFYASDYFDQLYEWAVYLVRQGKAYVDSLSAEEIREYRGTLTEPGRPSPYRDRSVEENLDLLERMRRGEFPDGAHVLRAKIDMAHPNLNMRDPVMYRIKHAHHHRTGDKWCIYPMYDWAHGQSDAIEGITHSICTLEFENHRPLYDWFLDNIPAPCHPRQIEFARLNMTYTVMSKRKLVQLVKEGHVRGWDDPRMPTLAGMRRRGFTPEAIRAFAERIGVARSENWIDPDVLEECVRDDLNPKVPRVMGVLRPLKVVLTNYPEDRVEELEAPYFPDDPPRMGWRKVPFCRELFIEQDDFMEDPPKKFFRLAPGREVRLRRAYIIRCDEVVRDSQGNISELRCSYDPETLNANPRDRKPPKGILHWVSARHAVAAEVRLYDRLFLVERPGTSGVDFLEELNPRSLEIVSARLEPSLARAEVGSRYQFERQGYFVVDPDSTPEALVFNRIVPLRDSWARLVQAGKVE
ncbi:MAG TPA: glutamine--tRNA ligase/YqeY domain fusion protein, partial [Candidatus Nitrosotenuis sp.]|nr:glutamine--tRNA ligase/YqeY domain fusion protein [Candidatus Nitrosotenuis sp.]